ncbi:MAG: hypothetical protein ABIK28_20545 [Planctomycetota bacterium]
MQIRDGKIIFLLFLFSACLVNKSLANEEEEALYLEGKKAFRSCAACHSVTEPTLKEDDDWLKLNWVTACINAGEMTPRVRKALDVYFRSPETRRPLLVDEQYTPENGQACGKIKVPPTSGSAFLKAERESIREGAPAKLRLYWKASEKGKTLTLPCGTYRVITYRYYKEKVNASESRNELWTLSVTDINGCGDIRVAEGQTTEFGFLPELQGRISGAKSDEGVKLSLAVRNEHDSILTLSRDGGMCLPDFVIIDAAGNEAYRAAFENT